MAGGRGRGWRWISALAGLLALLVGWVRWQLPFPYAAIVFAQAQRQGVDPYLVAAVIRVESRYQPDAISRRGALGLMQLMPATAAWIQSQPGAPVAPDGALNLGDARTNIALGTWYLRFLLRRYRQDVVLALAAYNSGPATVDLWIRQGRLFPGGVQYQQIPYRETRLFIGRVLWYRRLYRWVYGFPSVVHTGSGGWNHGQSDVRGHQAQAGGTFGGSRPGPRAGLGSRPFPPVWQSGA